MGEAIKERVATRQMPPWHLDKTVGIQEFANDRSLSTSRSRPWCAGWMRTAERRSQGHAAAKQWPSKTVAVREKYGRRPI